jgi:hypothetical protein
VVKHFQFIASDSITYKLYYYDGNYHIEFEPYSNSNKTTYIPRSHIHLTKYIPLEVINHLNKILKNKALW